MVIGFVGAGKVGCTLGKYFVEAGEKVSGYFSRNTESAQAAAEFTKTKYYEEITDIIKDSDAIFLTVPDGTIEEVWNSLKKYSIEGKVFCHCSGAMSSSVFSDIDRMKAFGYSIHPLFAIHSKWQSYKEISKAYFTIEGSEKYLQFWTDFFEKMGNQVRRISGDKKILYHSGAVFASNLVVGIMDMASEILMECGFDEQASKEALIPLFMNNCRNICNAGIMEALTGPVERGDIKTIEKHLSCLEGNAENVYRTLSRQLVKIAQKKHPDRDYKDILLSLELGGKK